MYLVIFSGGRECSGPRGPLRGDSFKFATCSIET